MKWLGKNKPEPVKTLEETLPEQHQASIEIVAHANAKAEVKKDIDRANAILEKIFKDNHFSLTLYLATRDQPKQKGSH